jgi:anti-sigma regulatory factor (Ser/Thr protein kinase)
MTSVSRGSGCEHDAFVLELERDQAAPSLARAAVNDFCEDRAVSPDAIPTVMLLVSEMVTNAVIHPDVDPPGTVRIHARISKAGIRVEVSDQGKGFTPRPPDPRPLGGGFGLYLLEKEAARWGVEQTPYTTVWFELALEEPRAESRRAATR